ncbi:tRNA glutamyl-Q(34) synthetase GluQRS [Glaciimonas immobilis]|uniref:Glutamyl-Q tRNA(Asp) synthetase n=1 Tax=Glaciimonas immobilis TaxID=728004 RepID=A0A840RRP9_9BURK|nr:tRNA glutamyl-Q(34) synthetase GluQRS [Glaciimonas immobilis]KAF3999953.1 tRNA glutamyl-Q(34) synthetase GluQRS [Glaciimonas immobilis]MBB5200455.1 glutamyl-Q tRNA(Asp) synthetase [Glaciimonas immobilis]
MPDATHYIGRFAPSPTGPLHDGALVAAMASYLDAKAHHGSWLVRMEDVDEARTAHGAAEAILHALSALQMHWDGKVVYQSHRGDLYQAAFDRLGRLAYPCGCTRREIVDSHIGVASDGAAVYPGTCRNGLPVGKPTRSYRLLVPEIGQAAELIRFEDRWQGMTQQHLAIEVGDFVLKRVDGFWTYQLAVIVDDANQGVTHVVRGADLLDSTPRQIYLQRQLQYLTPSYLHVPVITNANGEKLSKQNDAPPLDLTQPYQTLVKAAWFLGLEIGKIDSVEAFWPLAIAAWANQRLDRR